MFHEARAPSIEELQALLAQIITRLMRLLTRQGYLVEEQGMALGQPLRYLAEPDADDADHALTALRAALCTYRIALGSRAGQKVLSLRSLASTDTPSVSGLCANAHGFSLVAGLGPHAAVRCGADQRKQLEHLCSITTTAATSRYIARPAIANARLKRNGAGQVV